MRKHLLTIGGGVLVVLILLFIYKQRDSYYCQECWSKKDIYQWRLGLWMGASVPLTPSWIRITETHFQQDFLPTAHVHNWAFAQGSPYYLLGTTWAGCAIGAGRHVSEVCEMYNTSSEFRVFVQAKLKDGSLTKSNVLALVSNSANRDASQKDEQTLLDSFFGK
jgi:hypothetical protein